MALALGGVGKAASALSFRLACYAAMLWIALWAEARPAPTLPDWVLERVPYLPWVDRYNYLVWLLGYLPVAGVLLFRDLGRFCRYNVSSGLLALVRGACIAATGLGPVNGRDVNAGLDPETRWRAFWQLVSPLGFFQGNRPHLYLTKDLFFSGHTATTFLLLLYAWPYPPLRFAMLAGHLAVVATVFFSHLHYTIDVVGAYAVTFSLFALREGALPHLLSPPREGRAAR